MFSDLVMGLLFPAVGEGMATATSSAVAPACSTPGVILSPLAICCLNQLPALPVPRSSLAAHLQSDILTKQNLLERGLELGIATESFPVLGIGLLLCLKKRSRTSLCVCSLSHPPVVTGPLFPVAGGIPCAPAPWLSAAFRRSHSLLQLPALLPLLTVCCLCCQLSEEKQR